MRTIIQEKDKKIKSILEGGQMDQEFLANLEQTVDTLHSKDKEISSLKKDNDSLKKKKRELEYKLNSMSKRISELSLKDTEMKQLAKDLQYYKDLNDTSTLNNTIGGRSTTIPLALYLL